MGRVVHETGFRWLRITSRPEPQENGDVLWHGLIADVTETKEAEEKIRALLADKELLLREVHHRIKNNMATVTGLLTLQAANLSEPQAVAALDEARARVLSMMVLYDKLYQQGNITGRLPLADYLPALVEEVLSSFPPRAGVTWDCRSDELVLEVKTLSSLAILVNELLTNVMKYAFTGRTSGEVRVTAVAVGNRCRLEVADNGCGFPRGFDPTQSPGFGLGLVHLLSQSLGAVVTFDSQPGQGTAVRLEFEVD
jgi:two-component sensor histidine kinase